MDLQSLRPCLMEIESLILREREPCPLYPDNLESGAPGIYRPGITQTILRVCGSRKRFPCSVPCSWVSVAVPRVSLVSEFPAETPASTVALEELARRHTFLGSIMALVQRHLEKHGVAPHRFPVGKSGYTESVSPITGQSCGGGWRYKTKPEDISESSRIQILYIRRGLQEHLGSSRQYNRLHIVPFIPFI